MENEDSMSTPEAYHFFQIVLQDTIRNKRLGIPKKFLRKFGHELSSSVLLRVPSGDTWRVELTKPDGTVWLKNGWQEFFEFYSLEKGHFLLFKYEGNSMFLVLIFDMNTSEIEYPCSHTQDHKSSEQVCPEPVKEEAKDDICDKLDHEIPPSKETRKKDKNKKESGDLSNGEKDLQTEVSGDELAFGDSELCAKALQRAGAFKSENPFFLVTMQPSYVKRKRKRGEKCGRKVCIPKDFALKFLTEGTGYLTLRNSDGKTWYAGYRRYKDGHKYPKALIHIGWDSFMIDNNLKAGDVCVFELISQTETKFKVIIYRAHQDASCSSPLGGSLGLSAPESTGSKHHRSERPMTCNEKAIAMQRASNFESKNPFFKVVMQLRYLEKRNSQNVPYKFVKSYLDKEKNEAVLQVADGRTWIVKLVVSVVTGGQHKVEFYPWWTFARDNNLKIGDVCVFELINCHENSFMVYIYSATRGANSSLSPQGNSGPAAQHITIGDASTKTPKAEL